MKQIRKRLTYANVMSSLAVFLILGGATAFAALGKNSVGPQQLKKNAVTAAKIKKDAVTAAKIKNGSLLSTDFKVGQLPAGPKGDTGAKGDVGPTFGRSDDGGCDPQSTVFETCASTGPINLPTSGRVLLVGASSWDNDNEGLAPNAGTCRLTADGNEVGPEAVDFGEATSVHTIGKGGSVAVTTVTGPLSAGTHTFSLECNETDADVFLTDSTLSAVLLGGS
ncbi:MAG: hypothetical protein ABW196_04325 [Solirubrobacterales bacterium]